MTKKTLCNLLLTELSSVSYRLESFKKLSVNTGEYKEYNEFMQNLLTDNVEKIQKKLHMQTKKISNKKFKFLHVE